MKAIIFMGVVLTLFGIVGLAYYGIKATLGFPAAEFGSPLPPIVCGLSLTAGIVAVSTVRFRQVGVRQGV